MKTIRGDERTGQNYPVLQRECGRHSSRPFNFCPRPHWAVQYDKHVDVGTRFGAAASMRPEEHHPLQSLTVQQPELAPQLDQDRMSSGIHYRNSVASRPTWSIESSFGVTSSYWVKKWRVRFF